MSGKVAVIGENDDDDDGDDNGGGGGSHADHLKEILRTIVGQVARDDAV